MSKPVSSLADVQSLAARCIEMADPQLDADFEAKFGLAPADFAALPAQAQQAHLQSHADAAKGAKYAVGNWGHLFGSDRHETNCRIVIDVENGELVAAQEKDGLKFVDLRGERFRDLAESVIEVNEAHNGYLDYGLVLSNELPGWAGGLDNAVSTLQGNVEKPTRGQFVAEVQRRYESGQDNVFEAYRSVYGEPNDDESDLEYVRRCAEQDYADSVYGGCIYQDVIDQWPLIAQGNVSNGQGNVAELAKYVADFESGVIASRGAINDASFDQKRLAASKEAIASGSDHDVKECLNWWAEAIASGSLVQGQGNVATSKDHPDAFFDAQGKLFDWETGDPMPQGWTGIAKRKDTLFVIGQDGEETSYTALYAKTMVDALKEAAARNLLGVQGNVREEANGNAWLDSNVAYRLAAIRGGRDTPYSGKIMLDDRVVGNWFINTERERGAANGMFVKPEFREAFAKWAREKLDFTDALKLCGCDESSLNDPLAVTFLAGQTISSETVLQIMQALKVERLADKSADGSPSLGM